MVNFADMGFLGDDLGNIKPFDFPLIALKYTPPSEFKYTNEYYSTNLLTGRLMNTGLLTIPPHVD